MSTHQERLEKTLSFGYDPDACAELVRLYVRQSQPVTAWRLLRRLNQEVSSASLQLQLNLLQAQCKLIIIDAPTYTKTLNALRLNGRYAKRGYSGNLTELPRNLRKRAIVFYYASTFLDIGTRYVPKDIQWIMDNVLEDLALISDHCHMRRYMLSMRVLERTDDGAHYWVNPQNPIILA